MSSRPGAGALLDSDVLEDPEKVFVEAALDAVYGDVEAELDGLGADAEVIQEAQRVNVVEAETGSPDGDDGVSSTEDDGGERHG